MESLCIFLLVLLVLFANALEKPLVYTPLGAIQGTEESSPRGKRIYAFLGVPYAKPPIGELRFEEPRPVEKWPGVWPATENSAVCLQHMLNYDIPDLITGEEDCLYLNIYTPTISNSSLLPVLVFIHGGAFMYGSGNTLTPQFILDRADFVYVSVNYRLGPFGFLSTEDNVVPGNNGLKDQVVALKWVQENINYFGGNKNEVTFAGISAGGASVHLHYLSPQSRGLFKRGISLSGSAYCPWVMTEKSSEKAKLLALSVGCQTENSNQMVKCLKQRPGRKILAQLKSLFWPWLTLPFSPLGVVVESSGKNSFLNEHPDKLISEGKVSDLPWITSVTTDEGLYPGAAFVDRENLMKDLNDNWDQIIPHVLDYNHTISAKNLADVSKKIRYFYLGDKEVTTKTSNEIVQMVGDRLFVVDMERAARHQASVTKSPVYFYTFGYEGKYSITVFISKYNTTMGASHADDLIFILNRPIFSPLETEDDTAMMLKMTNIWTSFIFTGKPSPGGNVQWEAVGKDVHGKGNFKHLVINSSKDIKMVETPELGYRSFWDSLNFNELPFANDIKKPKSEL